MSAVADFCRRTQLVLADAVGSENLPNLKIANPGALAALMDPSNRNLVNVVGGFAGPKSKIFQVQYIRPYRTAASGQVLDHCEAGSVEGENFAQVVINKIASAQLTLDKETFKTMCSQFGEGSPYATAKMLEIANQLFKKINEDAAEYLVANVGNNSEGNTNPVELKLVKPDGSANHLGEITFAGEMDELEVSQSPLLVGGGIWNDYARIKAIACCNNIGVDASALVTPWAQFRDKAIGTESGDANYAIAFTPGAAQVFFHAFNVEENQVSTELHRETVTMLPFMGSMIPVDMIVHYDQCDKVYIITWQANYGFFSMPTDVDQVGSPWRGVNNIFGFKGLCSADGYCEIT